MFYLVKTPWLLRKIYPDCTWKIPTREKKLFLSFDDGPHPVATPFVLDQLKRYNAKATFFCIGKNVIDHPGIYHRIIDEGHAVGNHTHNHLNGWKTGDKEYFDNIIEAARSIHSNLFRPPYGRITKFQIRHLQESSLKMKIIMWTVLSADFDPSLTREQCLNNVMNKSKPGDIVLFHDSEKAFPKMSFAFPAFLKEFSGRGFAFDPIQ